MPGIGALAASLRIYRSLRPAIARADVVHAHSNGLLTELAVLLARRQQKPVVLTLYGTEIWHYEPKKPGPDLFTRAYHAASAVTFYSERLLARANELGLTRRGMHAIYPSVGHAFSTTPRRISWRFVRASAFPPVTCSSTSSGFIRWPVSVISSRR